MDNAVRGEGEDVAKKEVGEPSKEVSPIVPFLSPGERREEEGGGSLSLFFEELARIEERALERVLSYLLEHPHVVSHLSSLPLLPPLLSASGKAGYRIVAMAALPGKDGGKGRELWIGAVREEAPHLVSGMVLQGSALQVARWGSRLLKDGRFTTPRLQSRVNLFPRMEEADPVPARAILHGLLLPSPGTEDSLQMNRLRQEIIIAVGDLLYNERDLLRRSVQDFEGKEFAYLLRRLSLLNVEEAVSALREAGPEKLCALAPSDLTRLLLKSSSEDRLHLIALSGKTKLSVTEDMEFQKKRALIFPLQESVEVELEGPVRTAAAALLASEPTLSWRSFRREMCLHLPRPEQVA